MTNVKIDFDISSCPKPVPIPPNLNLNFKFKFKFPRVSPTQTAPLWTPGIKVGVVSVPLKSTSSDLNRVSKKEHHQEEGSLEMKNPRDPIKGNSSRGEILATET